MTQTNRFRWLIRKYPDDDGRVEYSALQQWWENDHPYTDHDVPLGEWRDVPIGHET